MEQLNHRRQPDSHAKLAVLMAIARCSARWKLDSIAEISTTVRERETPAATTHDIAGAICDVVADVFASSMRSFFSACATRGANSRDCFLAAE